MAAYLHPLAKATQLRHILGPAAHASRAAELARGDDPVVAEYPFLDPDEELTWGAFDGPNLVGVVHAEVRRPGLWVLGGVYVEPEARRRGRGHELIAVALAASARAGVRVALFVREDRAEARTLYEGVGFRPAGRRVWLDLGAGLSP